VVDCGRRVDEQCLPQFFLMTFPRLMQIGSGHFSSGYKVVVTVIHNVVKYSFVIVIFELSDKPV